MNIQRTTIRITTAVDRELLADVPEELLSWHMLRPVVEGIRTRSVYRKPLGETEEATVSTISSILDAGASLPFS
jgi:hypothetical protein